MAIVNFYEKPGCANNTKQKAVLKAAGHTIAAHNLLTQAWTVETLRPFFGELPVEQWFNPSAPRIQSGEVVPANLTAETALNLMIQDPLLIRRPLMQVGHRRHVGFAPDEISAWIALEALEQTHKLQQEHLIQQDLQTCPQSQQN
jgi:nitrogenase-associated protein